MGPFAVSPLQLHQRLGRADAPLIFDVCKCEDYDGQAVILPGARWRDHRQAATWGSEIPSGRQVVVVCVKGLKVSQAAAAELRRQGIDARILEGGHVAWAAAGLPTVRKRGVIGNREAKPSRWVTRIAPKIDRIACPWLITRFIDPAAQFYYVAPEQVVAAAAELDAIPYDVDGVEFSHRGDLCSFDTMIELHGISDVALDRVAQIVRGADTARLDLAPQAAGLLAISLGNSVLAGADDHDALARGMAVYDALYAWARFAAEETHNWPSKKG